MEVARSILCCALYVRGIINAHAPPPPPLGHAPLICTALKVTWSLSSDRSLAESLGKPAMRSRSVKGSECSRKHAELVPVQTNFRPSATINPPPRVLRGHSSEYSDGVEDGHGGAGGGDTEAKDKHAGKALVLYTQSGKHVGRGQEIAPGDVLPSASTVSSHYRRDLNRDGFVAMSSGDKKGEVKEQFHVGRPHEERAEKGPGPCQSGRLTKDHDQDHDQKSCHGQFFQPDALIPRLSIASLFLSPDYRGSGGDPLHDIGRRPHSVFCRPWSAGEQCFQQYCADDKRREGGFTSRTRRRSAFVGSAHVPAMVQGLPRTQRPHTVASGFRDLGLTYRSRSQRGGGHVDGSDSTSTRTWNTGGVISAATGGSKRHVGSIYGDTEEDMRVESSSVTLQHGGGDYSANGHGGKDTLAMRTVSNPLNAATGRNPGDGEGEPYFARKRKETPDSKSKSAALRKWGASRGRVVGGAVVGLTAEALGRSGVYLDRSGRIKLVEQVNAGSTLNASF